MGSSTSISLASDTVTELRAFRRELQVKLDRDLKSWDEFFKEVIPLLRG